MYLRFLFILILSFSSSFGSPQFSKAEKDYIEQHPVIKLGADYRWPPFDFVDKSGKHTGLSEDFIKLIEKKSGLHFEIESGVWSDVLHKMQLKKYDGLACAVKTDERQKYLSFTDPYLSVPMVIITQRGREDISSLKDLEGKRVSINKGSYINEWLLKTYPDIQLDLSSSNEESLERVSLGKADAYVGNLAVATYIINKNILNNLQIVTKLKEFNTSVSVAIDKEKPLLFGIIEKSIKDISPQEIQSVKSKWRDNFAFADEKLSLNKQEKAWIAKHKTIRYVIDNDWEPVEYLSEGGKYAGIASSYLDLIAKKTGIEFVRVPTKVWSQSVKKINAREADMYTCVAITATRKKVVNFSKPYINMPQVFVTKKNTNFITDIQQLYGKKVVLVEGYVVSEILKKEHPKIHYVMAKNIIQAFDKVVKGEADAYMDLLPVVSDYIQKRGYSNLKISGMSKYRFQFRMALRNDWDKTGINIINKAIDSISDGEKSKIYNRWVRVKYDTEVDYTLLLEVAGALLLLIAASLFWNRKLSQEISKRKEVEQQLKELNKKLLEATNSAQSANQAKSNFLSNMSHEIRTPMNSILGFAELLDEKIEDKKLKSFIKTIRSSGESLLLLINDILDLSKIESGKMEIVNSRTNLKKIVQESISLFTLQAQQKGLDLQFSINDQIPEAILSDPVRIKQILINLIGNALKFTDEGFVRVIVEFSRAKGHFSKVNIDIRVEDSGIGIAQEYQEKIFRVFEQQENQDVRKYGGTGLGLAISRKLAILMDGSLSVQSEEGRGSCFILRLNNTAVASLHENESTKQKELYNTTIKFEAATILVADDVAQNRFLVKESFDATPVKVLEAVNGEDALEKVKKNQIDLILMDIRMPVLDGYSATRIIKQEFDIPIIALTASIMQEELQKIQQQRFDGYLRKPVSKSELYGEMARFLAHSRIEKQKTDAKLQKHNEAAGFIDSISEQIKTLYFNAIKSNDLDKIQKLADALLELAKRDDNASMQSFAQTLLEKIDLFEIEEISKMLKEFGVALLKLQEGK